MKVAVDAMGSDYAPKEIILGAIQAVQEYDCEVMLVGDEIQIRQVLETIENWEALNISIYHASETIEMYDHPSAAVHPSLWQHV